MRAVILAPVIAQADAVGNDIRAMARVLGEYGVEVRLACQTAHGGGDGMLAPEEVLDFAGGPHDLLIYHFSMGWGHGVELLRQARGFRVVRYHNITPPEFFAPFSEDFAKACRAGRAEIASLAALGCELYLGASAYNNADFIAAGVPARNCAVLPPFHRVDALREASADPALLARLQDGVRNVLMIGRIAPNKGHPQLVDAFAAWLDAYGEPARLLLVGKTDPRLEAYTDSIRERIAAHGIEDRVAWFESLGEAELKAAFVASHAFMTLSQHEGFCVPLVEAMALGTPVVAHAACAIPETLGEAGLAWPETDPWIHAASLARLAADDYFRESLCAAARDRYEEHFATTALRVRLLQLLRRAL